MSKPAYFRVFTDERSELDREVIAVVRLFFERWKTHIQYTRGSVSSFARELYGATGVHPDRTRKWLKFLGIEV